MESSDDISAAAGDTGHEDDAYRAEDVGEERVTELPQSIEPKVGDIPLVELESLRAPCEQAERDYREVVEVIRTIRASNVVLARFHARAGEVTPKDVESAKKQFHEAKKSYIQLGNQINEGIKQVYVAAKTYPQDLLVQNLYITYLAKLLSSLEAKNPVEPYVRRLAEFYFAFDREDVILTEEERRRDMTVEQKKKELLENAERTANRLEARYQKRQLHIRMRGGERPLSIVKHLVRLSKQDPEDIHTLIWIASLLAGELGKVRDQNRRLEMRDDILAYCQRAFSLIDDFLNLQGIQNLSERDKRRAEYVRTITQIRKPLVQG